MIEKQELVRNLQDIIQDYDKILFLKYDISKIIDLCFYYSKERINKKVFLMSKEKQENCLNGIDCFWGEAESREAIQKLYYTYEFSNKFSILSVSDNFGTIWNYVKTGVLTLEEALSALLD